MLRSIYYNLKPYVPQRVIYTFRRKLIKVQRLVYNDIWPIDEKAGNPPEGWSGWPEDKQFALVLTHDVETTRGYEKCEELMNLEKELGFRSSFNFVPKRYNVSRELRHSLVSNGFEVGIHVLFYDGKLYKSKKIFFE